MRTKNVRNVQALGHEEPKQRGGESPREAGAGELPVSDPLDLFASSLRMFTAFTSRTLRRSAETPVVGKEVTK
jgi:hypothetical protein